METAEKLKEITSRQRILLADLEREVQLFEDLDPVKEKECLEIQLIKLTADLDETKKALAMITEEHSGLKNRLFEQIYFEKLTILNQADQKMNIYFKTNLEEESNALLLLEQNVKANIAKIKKQLQTERIEAEDEIRQTFSQATELLDKKREELRQLQQIGPYSQTDRAKLQSLKEAQITEEQLKQLEKKNNLESLVGLNIINKLGIFLILVGVITASRYTYVLMPNMLKGIMMFVLGGLMLTAGELLNRKKANVFSLGISAIGVAVFYIALSVSYFGLHIMTMYPAIILCILITAVTFLLSTRYRSQTILSFALIGGYLPIFSIGGDSNILYGAIVYFIILNLLALFISFERKWSISSFIGLFLNLIGTFSICFGFYQNNTRLDQVLSIGYVIFAFLVYTLIPIWGTYRAKTRFKIQDVVLIAFNTLFSSFIMYLLFLVFGLGAYDGILTIFFALVYLMTGRLIETKFINEKKMTGLFYLTGLTFVILTVPLQFGMWWLSMGWLAEGIALLVYGILKKEKLFKLVGVIVSGFCLLSFLTLDLLFSWRMMFVFKYLAITLGSILILWALIYKNELKSLPERIFKYVTVANIWFYLQFIIYRILKIHLMTLLAESGLSYIYLTGVIAVAGTLLFSYLLQRIKLLMDHPIKIMSLVIYLLGFLHLLFLNFSTTIFVSGSASGIGTAIAGTLIVLAVSLLSLLALYDTAKFFVLNCNMPIGFYPLILSGYFVILLTQILIFQYHLAFSDAVISIIYVTTAFVWIVLGFIRRYSFLRRFGLGLAILGVVKLFIADLYTLTQEYKILSYFILGVILLAISFVYQYFNKRLESGQEGSDDKKN